MLEGGAVNASNPTKESFMRRAGRLRFVVPLIAILICLPYPAAVRAAANEEAGIPPGTVITPANWQQYRQFMTDGMQALFSGGYNWKFPDDYRLVVGPTKHYSLPPTYLDQTQKYASQVKIVNLPDGRHTIDGYVGGIPFPNPQEPMKGWKLLVDDWYAYATYILCTNTCALTFEDRFNNLTQEQFFFVQRLFSHRGDAGLSVDDPASPGTYYTEIIEVLDPEQARYTAVLTLYYADLTRSEDTFLF